jgi:hypothetical protein
VQDKARIAEGLNSQHLPLPQEPDLPPAPSDPGSLSPAPSAPGLDFQADNACAVPACNSLVSSPADTGSSPSAAPTAGGHHPDGNPMQIPSRNDSDRGAPSVALAGEAQILDTSGGSKERLSRDSRGVGDAFRGLADAAGFPFDCGSNASSIVMEGAGGMSFEDAERIEGAACNFSMGAAALHKPEISLDLPDWWHNGPLRPEILDEDPAVRLFARTRCLSFHPLRNVRMMFTQHFACVRTCHDSLLPLCCLKLTD